MNPGTATITSSVGVKLPISAHLPDGLSEKVFQSHVVRLAKENGFMVYHTYDSRRSESGFPDLILSRGAVLMAVELKTDTGTVSAAQDAWLAAFRAGAVLTFVWRPRDWCEVVRVLTAPHGS